ncbi:hypothetical protein BGX20_005605 [Mortierella sp. AD010]|nr:hypothetical protein BGX20_005605 [Mortierella sp. AD010]
MSPLTLLYLEPFKVPHDQMVPDDDFSLILYTRPETEENSARNVNLPIGNPNAEDRSSANIDEPQVKGLDNPSMLTASHGAMFRHPGYKAFKSPVIFQGLKG